MPGIYSSQASTTARFLNALRKLREKAAADGVPLRAVAHLDMAMMAAEDELRRWTRRTCP